MAVCEKERPIQGPALHTQLRRGIIHRILPQEFVLLILLFAAHFIFYVGVVL